MKRERRMGEGAREFDENESFSSSGETFNSTAKYFNNFA